MRSIHSWSTLVQRRRATQLLGALAACLLMESPQTQAQTTFTLGTEASPYNVGGTGTFAWSSQPWSPSVPGSSAGDSVNMVIQAGAVSSGSVNWTLGGPITLKSLSYAEANAYDARIGTDPTKQTITFDSGQSAVAATLLTSRTNNLNMLRFFLDANAVLNSDLEVTHTRLNTGSGRTVGGLTGVLSGPGELTVGFVSPSATPTSTTIYEIGATGGAANTHSGGTQINGFNSAMVFRAQKADAFGTGVLTIGTATVNMNNFAQTVGGLAGGTGGASITNGGANLRTLTLDFSSSGGPFAYSGAITGGANLAVVKAGSGMQTLSGASTYTGATTVASGTLVLNGSLANATLGVTAGATLKGSGSIAGQTTISGTHAPGNSPGIQTFADLAYAGGSANVEWDLTGNTTSGAGVNFDQIVVGGGLDFAMPTSLNLVFNATGSTVDWTNAFWTEPRSWLLYDVAGTTTNVGNLAVNVAPSAWLDSQGNSFSSSPVSSSTFSVTKNGEDVLLTYVPVPEPAAWLSAVAGGLLAAGTLIKRRHAISARSA